MASYWFIVSQLQIHPCWLLSETVSGLYIFLLCQLALRFHQQGALQRRCWQKCCLLALGGVGSASSFSCALPSQFRTVRHTRGQILPAFPNTSKQLCSRVSMVTQPCMRSLSQHPRRVECQQAPTTPHPSKKRARPEAEPCPHRKRHTFWIWIPPALTIHGLTEALSITLHRTVWSKNSFHSKEKSNNVLKRFYHRYHPKVASQAERYKWLLKTQSQSKLTDNIRKACSENQKVKAGVASLAISPNKQQFSYYPSLIYLLAVQAIFFFLFPFCFFKVLKVDFYNLVSRLLLRSAIHIFLGGPVIISS